MLFNGIVSIWLIRVITPWYYFWNVMSQKLGTLPPPCHTMLHFVDPPPSPLTCDVIYGCPLISNPLIHVIIAYIYKRRTKFYYRMSVIAFRDLMEYKPSQRKKVVGQGAGWRLGSRTPDVCSRFGRRFTSPQTLPTPDDNSHSVLLCYVTNSNKRNMHIKARWLDFHCRFSASIMRLRS